MGWGQRQRWHGPARGVTLSLEERWVPTGAGGQVRVTLDDSPVIGSGPDAARLEQGLACDLAPCQTVRRAWASCGCPVGGQAYATSVGFDLSVPVSIGSTVDFALTPGPAADLDYDATNFTASLTTSP